MTNWIRNRLRKLYWRIFKKYALMSFSQFGEDILLFKLFHPKKSEGLPVQLKKNGFYIDIGANHPIANSNTYFLYDKGWNGINVDPLPGMKELFDVIRPRDINVQVGIASRNGVMKYHMYDNSFINSFSFDESQKISSQVGARYLGSKDIPVYTLSSLLDERLEPNRKIDFMSIDAEGLDMEILESNDWNKYRPKFIMVEANKNKVCDIMNLPVVKYLSGHDYSVHSVIIHNILFEDDKNLEYQHKY